MSKDDVKKSIAFIKDEITRKIEIDLNLPEITEDLSIEDNKKRKEDYEQRRFRFDKLSNSFRLSRIAEAEGIDKANEIKKKLDKYKAIPSKIELEGETPLLKMSKENWNYLFEGEDFELTLDGKINFKI